MARPCARQTAESAAAGGTATGLAPNDLSNASIYVSHVPLDVGEEDLSACFARYGVVKQVKWRNDKGFAFIDFAMPHEAQAAVASASDVVRRPRAPRALKTIPPLSHACIPCTLHRAFTCGGSV